MRLKQILFIIALTFSLIAAAGPAKKGTVMLKQPDGTYIQGRISGDEFYKLTTTLEGYAITQDQEGWWCYARYESDGQKFCTGWRVGEDAPAQVKSESTRIPYKALAENAAEKRLNAFPDEEPLLSRIMDNEAVQTKASTKTKHGIVILAQFKDVSFKYSRIDFVNMLILKGYKHNGAMGCAKEYFDDQFHGSIEFDFDVSEIVTLPQERAFYGKNGKDDSDENPAQMVVDACRLVDSSVDFSMYDDDGDGDVDNVFVFFAGGDEAWGAGEDCIWSHAWYVKSGAGITLTLDGKLIDKYACTSELTQKAAGQSVTEVLAGIGTFCHEYSHTFGLPDLYDTDYEGSEGMSAGLWESTALMDAGNQNSNGNAPPYFNAIEREILGISKPTLITKDGGYELEPIHLNGKYYRINTDTDSEYYLIECRSNEGWDKAIGGYGMLVYHIDKSTRATGMSDRYNNTLRAIDRWTFANEVNCRPDHQCADLIEADSRVDRFPGPKDENYIAQSKDIRTIFFPCEGVNSLPSDGSEGLKFWSGMTSQATLSNIRFASDKSTILFNVIGFSGTETPPVALNTSSEVFMDAAILQFNSSKAFEGEATVAYGRTGYLTDTLKVKPYETGKYSVTLEGLIPDSKTYTASISFEINGVVGEAVEVSFMTKKSPAVKWPFIYTGSFPTNEEGAIPVMKKIPLRVYNASNAAEIRWTLNRKAIKPGGDGYYQVTEKGTLKAHITWEDGTEETVMKELIVDF